MLIISSAGHLSVPPCGLYYPNIQGFCILAHPAFLAISSTVSLHTQCACMLSLQLCPPLCNSMDCSPTGSSVHGILQARILEWVAMTSSRNLPHPEVGTHVSYISRIGRQVLYRWRHLGSWCTVGPAATPASSCPWTRSVPSLTSAASTCSACPIVSGHQPTSHSFRSFSNAIPKGIHFHLDVLFSPFDSLHLLDTPLLEFSIFFVGSRFDLQVGSDPHQAVTFLRPGSFSFQAKPKPVLCSCWSSTKTCWIQVKWTEYRYLGVPRWLRGKESACHCRRWRRLSIDPWVRKIPWSRRWQAPPVHLPGKFHV